MPRWCKVEGRTRTGINRGSSTKSLKRRHLSGCQSPTARRARARERERERERDRATWLARGIRVFLQRTDFSVFIGGERGPTAKIGLETARTRAYASVCSALEPLENRWTALHVSAHLRDATSRAFPGSRVESLFYERGALFGPARLCTHARRQDTVGVEPRRDSIFRDVQSFSFGSLSDRSPKHCLSDARSASRRVLLGNRRPIRRLPY